MRQRPGRALAQFGLAAGMGFHMRHLLVVELVEESVAEGRSRRVGGLGGGGVVSLAAGRRREGVAWLVV